MAGQRQLHAVHTILTRHMHNMQGCIRERQSSQSGEYALKDLLPAERSRDLTCKIAAHHCDAIQYSLLYQAVVHQHVHHLEN